VRDACAKAQTTWRSIGTWMQDPANMTVEGVPFLARYARARSMSAEVYADRAVTTVEDVDTERLSSEAVQLARLKVDTYKWRAAMADPKGYGDRKQVEVTGSVSHLHLDALKAPRVSARANLIGANGIAALGGATDPTVSGLLTERSANPTGDSDADIIDAPLAPRG